MFFLSSIAGCGSVTEETGPAPTPSDSPNPIFSADVNNPQGNTAFVLGSDFQTIGTYATLTLEETPQVSPNLGTTHTDAVVRSFNNLLYIVNRKGQDNIQVVDPKQGYKTISQFSVGRGTDPHDILVLNPTTAYITLYEPEANNSTFTVDDLLVVNPQTGIITQTIDLTPYADSDGEPLARADRILWINGKLFVSIQDLAEDFKVTTEGKILVINPTTGKVEKVIRLSGRNPFDIKYSPSRKKIFVSLADFFNNTSPYGGIEVVDTQSLNSRGILISDNQLGGAPADIELNTKVGYVVVGSYRDGNRFETSVVRFDPDAGPAAPFKTVYQSAAYIPDIALLGDLLIVGDSDPANGGVFLLDAETEAPVAGPISVGPPPVAITFFNRP
ncbi:MAG: hypothetical protein HYS22_06950 [Deltaproteobacteria bacterium]|nr:hypothetical protein [Deltaproteobacteria bacterium]